MHNYEVTKSDGIESRQDPKEQLDTARLLFRDRFLLYPARAIELINRSHDCLRVLQSLGELRLKQESMYIKEANALCSSAHSISLHELYNQRKHLVLQFTDEVNEEIIKPIDTYLSRHRAMVNDLERDRQKLSECKDSLVDEVTQSAATLHLIQASIKSLVAKNETNKWVSLCRLYTEYKSETDNHKRLQQSLNAFLGESYSPSMSTILNMYQDMVDSAQDLFNDCTRKMTVFEVSLNRGFQYDLDKFATADITFSPIIPQSPPAVASALALPDLLDDDLKELITRSFSTSSADEDFYITIKPRVCSSFEIDVNEIESIRHQLIDRVTHCTFFQSIESDVSSFTSITAIQNLGRLIWVLLDDCDTDSLCRVCCLARRVYCTDIQGRRKFLQSEIYDHPIWNRIKVWEEMLSDVIAQTICSVSATRISLDDFGTYILMFGWSFDSALKLVERVIGDSFSWYSGKVEIQDRLLKGLNKAAERQLRTTRAGT